MARLITVTVVLLVAVGGGWLWGAYGRWSIERMYHTLELRQDLVEGRSALLDARLDVYSVNFGDASRHLESARALLVRAAERLRSFDRDDEATQVQAALTGIDDAQRMAGNLDQNANTRTSEPAKIVADVLGASLKR